MALVRDLWLPSSLGTMTGPIWPSIEAENFELRPGLIALVLQNQFRGLPNEDPHEHICNVLEYANTVQYHGFPKMLSSVCCSHSLSEMMLVLGIDPCHQDHSVGMRYHELSWINISHYTSSPQFEMRSSASFSVKARACMMLGRDTKPYSGDVLIMGSRDG